MQNLLHQGLKNQIIDGIEKDYEIEQSDTNIDLLANVSLNQNKRNTKKEYRYIYCYKCLKGWKQ